MKRVVNLVKNSWRFRTVVANSTVLKSFLTFGASQFVEDPEQKIRFKYKETLHWMLREFAPLKSKHDCGIAEANQQNLLNVIANEVKQSFLHCHCEPKARQSSSRLISKGLPRRYAPRNDGGRSMIEMLGVLAIIAVLSVGGLAGYSKAMQMYRLNKWYANLVQMITDVQTAYINQKSYADSNKNLTSMFISTGIIPEGILDENHKDILGNKLNIITNDVTVVAGVFRINFQHQLAKGKEAVACCKKLYESSQYFSSLWAVDITDFEYVVCGKSAPKIYSDYYKCRPYNLEKVANKCAQCETQNCTMNFIFDNSSF